MSFRFCQTRESFRVKIFSWVLKSESRGGVRVNFFFSPFDPSVPCEKRFPILPIFCQVARAVLPGVPVTGVQIEVWFRCEQFDNEIQLYSGGSREFRRLLSSQVRSVGLVRPCCFEEKNKFVQEVRSLLDRVSGFRRRGPPVAATGSLWEDQLGYENVGRILCLFSLEKIV